MAAAVDIPWAADRKSTRLNSSHTVIYTLSLHDALPIYLLERFRLGHLHQIWCMMGAMSNSVYGCGSRYTMGCRSEEHTSELQSHSDLHSFPTRRSSDLSVGALQAWAFASNLVHDGRHV